MIDDQPTPPGNPADGAPPAVRLRPELTDRLVGEVRTAFRESRPTLLVIHGDAGSGKSRLCREVAAEAAVDGRFVAQSAVLAEAHMSLVSLVDFEEALTPFGGAAGPENDPGSPPTIPVLGMRLRRRIEEIASTGPFLAIFDDTHWMDSDSFDVMSFALRRLRDVPFAVMVTARNPGPGLVSGQPVDDVGSLFQPRRIDLAHRIAVDLAPADPDLVAAALAEVAPALSDASRRQIAVRAGGNIFWSRELARTDRGDGSYDLSLTSPVARERLGRLAQALSGSQRALVSTVQLAGRPSTAELIAALEGTVPDPVAEIDEAEAARLIELVGQVWTLTHPLLGEAAVSALAPTQRAALLRRLAGIVDDAEQRARMSAEFERPPHEPTARLLVAASEAAADRGSLTAAVELMRLAVTFTDGANAAGRGARVASVVGLHRRRGAFAEVLDTVGEMDLDSLRPGAFDAVASAVAEAALLTRGHGAAQRVVGRFEAAADRRGDPMSKAVALALASDREFGTATDRLAAARAAAAVLETAPWPSPATHMVLGSLTTLLIDRGEALDPEAVDRRRALEPRLRHAGLMPPASESADALPAYVAKQIGDPAASKRRLPDLIEQADRVGEEFSAFAFRVHLALAHHRCGEFSQAGELLAHAETSLSSLPTPLFPALLLAKAWQAMADHGSDEAARLIREETAAAPDGPPRWLLVADILLGSVDQFEGRHDRAGEAFRRARATAEALEVFDPGRRYSLDVLLAQSLLAEGDLDAAEVEVDALAAFAVPRGRVELTAAAARIGALVTAARGDLVTATHALTAAIEETARSPFRIEQGQLLVALASVERRRRRGRAAAVRLDEAEVLFAGMPFAVGIEAVRQERAALRRQDGERAASLTPAERQVAEAVAGGATSRETGARLNVSPRTVEAHLRSIYRKLGVNGRVGLAALVHGGELETD